MTANTPQSGASDSVSIQDTTPKPAAPETAPAWRAIGQPMTPDNPLFPLALVAYTSQLQRALIGAHEFIADAMAWAKAGDAGGAYEKLRRAHIGLADLVATCRRAQPQDSQKPTAQGAPANGRR